MASSDPTRDAPPGVRVTFLDQTGAKSVEAMIAPSVTVARVVPNLITKLNLPVTGPDGQPMTYSLDHKEGGRRLREDESLVEAGVATGDHLIIYPEIVAGAENLSAGLHPAEPPIAASTAPRNPRHRRLESDLRRLEELASQSTIFSFTTPGPQPRGGPPEVYRVRFRGPGLAASENRGELQVRGIDDHEVLLQLVAEYPRSAPHMRWLTPLFHPNVSAAGAVCLGGWGTHWAPSLQLDRLCEMLWDMLRFANYDTRSPYNQRAAGWLLAQRLYRLPLDHRELRDRATRLASDARSGPPAAAAPDILFLD